MKSTYLVASCLFLVGTCVFAQEPQDFMGGGIPSAINYKETINEQNNKLPDVKNVSRVSKKILENYKSFRKVSGMFVNENLGLSYGSNADYYAIWLFPPVPENATFTCENLQAKVNGVSRNLISPQDRGYFSTTNVPSNYWIYIEGYLECDGNKKLYFKLLVDSQAVVIRDRAFIYLANLVSEVFFYEGPDSWAVSTNREKFGTFMPLYLSKDTVSNEYSSIVASRGKLAGFISIMDENPSKYSSKR